MPKFRNFQTNFSGGLLSKGMLGRVDLSQYENGCKQLENWWPKVAGGARRRPGTVFLNDTVDCYRIEPWVFNEDQTYLVSFHEGSGGEDEIQFWNEETGAQIDTLSVSIIGSSNIAELSITQAGDKMFIAHEDFPTYVVTRTSASTFSGETIANLWEVPPGADSGAKSVPFVKFADPEVTLAVNGFEQGAAVVLTTSPAAFVDTIHDNTIVRYRGKQILITGVIGGPFFPTPTANGLVLEDLDRGCTLTFNNAIDEPRDFDVGEIVVGDTSGIKGVVTGTTNTTITLAMIGGFFPAGTTEGVTGLSSGNKATITGDSTINPPAIEDWDEEAWTSYRGYPSVVEFHSQRLWFAGSPSLPAHIFGSRVAAFFNFNAGDALPADSIQIAINSKQVNLVVDIVSADHLQVFTDAAEFYAPQTEDTPLTPETFNLKRQTAYGSKRYVEPKMFDESTLFVQAKGNAIREFIWVAQNRGYVSEAVSLIAEEHVNDIQEVDVLYGGYDRPEQIAFFLNGDGTITWYHASRPEQIRQWGIWTTNGTVQSICVLKDKLYQLVERDADGTPTQFLERYELDVTVDCSVTKVSAGLTPVSTFAGHMAHLPNTEVELVVSLNPDGAGSVGGAGVFDQILSADYYLGAVTTNGSGATALTGTGVATVTNLTAGLAYTQTLETMPIEVQDNQGVTSGLPKRIVYSDVYMASTLAIKLQGYEVITYTSPVTIGVPPAPITGNRKFYLLGYNERPTLTITNAIPLPCEALAVSGEVEY